MEEVFIKWILFERYSWFKLSNFWLTLGMALKFYSSVAKGLQLKVKKFWVLIPTFVEVTREKLVGAFCLPSWLGLTIFGLIVTYKYINMFVHDNGTVQFTLVIVSGNWTLLFSWFFNTWPTSSSLNFYNWLKKHVWNIANPVFFRKIDSWNWFWLILFYFNVSIHLSYPYIL